MAKALDKPPGRMTVEQFVDWAMATGGRYELLDGEVVATAPERAAHARLKRGSGVRSRMRSRNGAPLARRCPTA